MKEITNDNFKELVLDSKNLVVLDLWAPWCGPCKMIAPILEELSVEYPNVDFLKCNIDNNHDIAVQYGIRSIPTLLFFKNGKVVNTEVGVVPKPTLAKKINTTLTNN